LVVIVGPLTFLGFPLREVIITSRTFDLNFFGGKVIDRHFQFSKIRR